MQEFEVELPAVTRLVTSVLYPPAIVFLGVAFAAAICTARNPTYSRRLWSISVVATAAVGLLSVYGFLQPLTSFQ